jgi:hypothetical protein
MLNAGCVLKLNKIQPSIYQQLWAIILPAASYVQNPMVSSWFHVLGPGTSAPFSFVKTSRRPMRISAVILGDDFLRQSNSL